MDKDVDLDDPQTNALTTPDLDGDDVQDLGEGKKGDDGDKDVPEARPA